MVNVITSVCWLSTVYYYDVCLQVGKECTQCGLLFGQYFCAVCRLYDDTDKGQFHCEKCGLCRVGGSENFFHCDTCGFCLTASMRETHACRLQASKNNCPVCMEVSECSYIYTRMCVLMFVVHVCHSTQY